MRKTVFLLALTYPTEGAAKEAQARIADVAGRMPVLKVVQIGDGAGKTIKKAKVIRDDAELSQ